MSWLAIIALAVGVSGQRLIGMFWAGPVLARRPFLTRLSDLLPAAVIAGVIVQLTFTVNAQLATDARTAGLLAACIMVWRRAPLYLVVLVAAAATALTRLVF